MTLRRLLQRRAILPQRLANRDVLELKGKVLSLFNPEKTWIGKIIAIFWTINDPPGFQRIMINIHIYYSLSVYHHKLYIFIYIIIYHQEII